MRSRAGFALAVLLIGCAPARASTAVCAECHRDIYDAWRATPMAQSARAVDAAAPPESFARSAFDDAKSGYRYRVARKGGRYVLDFTNAAAGISGSKTLAYAVGSGVRASSYLLSDNGYLYEAPVAYYAAGHAWGLAPAYQTYGYPFLTRPIPPGCLGCHASFLQFETGTVNRYASPPFHEGGVACERCHGDGERHTAKMQSGNPEGDPLILNPAKLPPVRRDSVCAQCHLTGAVKVMRPGHDWRSFRPGDALTDHQTVFVRAGKPSALKVTGHVENLASSGCKRGAGDRLWCGSCHDPHTVPSPAQAAAYFRARCLGCHSNDSCTEARAVRARKQDDCIGCHMPKSPAADAEHTVFTDHSIPRKPRPAPAAPDLNAELLLFGGGTASLRDLALAYAFAAIGKTAGADHRRALDLLPRVLQESPDDIEALVSLAEIYRNTGRNDLARPLYERALTLEPGQATASVGLGGVDMEAGDYPAAIRLWKSALTRNEGLQFVRVNLAVALLRTGDRAGAASILQRGFELNPAFAPIRQLLKELNGDLHR
jgi:predicted CXXCH cytochrome family protein